ncbi:MAG: sigma factor-like helix-turn-helix DNA-binding protein [Ignavibacteria bacterium]|nr:sigma factor-like helix-turn-helix DNA-binding protein [Ignavibacteria bacterium]
MKRNWIDSEGNKGRMILFSEMPSYVVDKLQIEQKLQRMPQTLLKEEYLKCLTLKQLEVITMRFWGDMDVSMIAKKVGILPCSVRRRLNRAYQRLKKAVKEH